MSIKAYWKLNWEQITAGLLLLQLKLVAELISMERVQHCEAVPQSVYFSLSKNDIYFIIILSIDMVKTISTYF